MCNVLISFLYSILQRRRCAREATRNMISLNCRQVHGEGRIHFVFLSPAPPKGPGARSVQGREANASPQSVSSPRLAYLSRPAGRIHFVFLSPAPPQGPGARSVQGKETNASPQSVSSHRPAALHRDQVKSGISSCS